MIQCRTYFKCQCSSIKINAKNVDSTCFFLVSVVTPRKDEV